MAVFAALVCLLFLYTPLLLPVSELFRAGCLHWSYELLTDAMYISSLWFSIKTALITSIIATAISVLLALQLRHTTVRWRVLMMLNYITPDIVVGISLLSMFSTLGIKTCLLTLMISYISMYSCTCAYWILRSLDGIRQEQIQLEEAARDLGASRLNINRYIILPPLRHVIFISFVYTVSAILNDVVFVTLLSGNSGPALPTLVLSNMRYGVDNKLNALVSLVILMLGICTILYYLSQRMFFTR